MLVGFFLCLTYSHRIYDTSSVKLFGITKNILYLYCMRERLIALIVFLLITDHPCRMRVRAIEIEPLSKIEICFKPR
jgi:hypothetical protein